MCLILSAYPRIRIYGTIGTESGEGIAPDFACAAEWFDQSAQQGHPDAWYQQGECLGLMNQWDQAISCYKKAANQGHVDAMYRLGCCYQKGQGTEVEPGLAVKWFRRAAVKGYADAQYSLGECFYSGSESLCLGRTGKNLPSSTEKRWHKNLKKPISDWQSCSILTISHLHQKKRS